MLSVCRKLFAVLLVLSVALSLAACGGFIGSGGRGNLPLAEATVSRLKSMGSSPREAMLVRIFKESSELEVWKRTSNGQFKLFQTYDICAWSGELGPKIKEGDRQSPEGFYSINPGLLNPHSSYYLAFNTGFPNKFDRAYGRTGSDLMVHGDCSSRGCYAMTDEGIKEIYALARESFKGGNHNFQLQIFPFRMTADNLAKHAESPHLAFWKDIKEGYDLFELNRTPPKWDVCDKQYVFNPTGSGPLDPVGPCPVIAKDANLVAHEQTEEQNFTAAVLSIEEKQAKADAEAQKAAAEQAAIEQRGEAIGGFFSGIFGGGGEPVEKMIDPNLRAPTPAPRLKRD